MYVLHTIFNKKFLWNIINTGMYVLHTNFRNKNLPSEIGVSAPVIATSDLIIKFWAPVTMAKASGCYSVAQYYITLGEFYWYRKERFNRAIWEFIFPKIIKKNNNQFYFSFVILRVGYFAGNVFSHDFFH